MTGAACALALLLLACSNDNETTGPGPASVAPCIAYDEYLHTVGSLATPGDASDIAVSGASAYVAATTAGLQIINISEPSSPALTGAVDTPGSAEGIAVSAPTRTSRMRRSVSR
jgi:hypothetical protein